MLRLLTDENFNGDIIRGLFLRKPDIDLVRIQDVGLIEADDPKILAWAARQERILLTHDRATMPDFAYQRISKKETMSGLFVVNDRATIRQVINDLLLIDSASEQSEWCGILLYIPM